MLSNRFTYLITFIIVVCMLHGRVEGDPRHGVVLSPLLPRLRGEGGEAPLAVPLGVLQEGGSGSGQPSGEDVQTLLILAK